MDFLSLLAVLCIHAKIVTGTVTVTESSGTNTVTSGGSLVLTCDIDNWTQGLYWNIPALGNSAVCPCQPGDPRTPPTADPRITCEAVTRGVTMNIANVAFSDRGQYTCIHFVSPQESGQLSITVQVPISSVDVTSPSTASITVTEGTPSDFVCRTSQGYPKATITWYKQLGSNAAVDLGSGSTVVEGGPQVVTKSTLQLIPSRTDHGYKIYCTAYNIDQSSVKTSVNQPQLTVNYAPEAPVIADFASGSDFFVLDDKQQKLTCSVQGGRPSPRLTWNCFNGNEQDMPSGATVAKEITWTAARAQDGQWCTCQSNHLLGNRQVHVVIKALYPPSTPTFTVGGQSVPGPVYVIEGRSVSVTCRSTSFPPPSYTWILRESSQSNNVLILSGVQTESTYTCTVSNTMTPSQGDPISGENSSTINVKVLYPPRTPTLTYDSVNGPNITSPFKVVRGDDFGIYCDAVGNPQPSYQWSGQSTNNEKLTVTDIQTDTSWTCTATNTMRPTAAASETKTSTTDASVVVLYIPSTPSLQYYYSITESVTLQTDGLQVIKGKSFNVKCSGSDSKPPADYKWSCAFASQAGTLTVDNIGVPSGGNNKVCTCTANNTMARTYGPTTPGTSTRDMTINVLYAPEVAYLTDETAVENATFSKSCTATPGNPSVTQYKWTKDGQTVVQQQTLTISKISRSHAGTYRCNATNDMQPTGENAENGSDSKTFSLIVHYSAAIKAFTINNTQGEGQHTFTENSTIPIRCQVDSNPESKITISKDGSALQTLEDTKEVGHTVTRARCLDAGRYSCSAYNQYNGDRPTVSGQVFVSCHPRRNGNAEQIIKVFKARYESATLSIEVIAYPTPNFTWFVENNSSSDGWTPVTANITSDGNRANMTIGKLELADFRHYKVEVKNSIPPDFSQYWDIKPQGKPDKPTNVRVMTEGITETSAVVQWTPGFNGGLNQTFIIQYTIGTDGADGQWTEVHGGVETKNKMIENLSPNTVYTVQVYANNTIGESDKSESIQFTTLDEPSPPGVSIGLIAGAAGGSIAALIVIAVVVILVIRKRKAPKRTSRRFSNGDDNDNFEPEIVENQQYVSAGDFQQKSSANGTGEDYTYSTVSKTQATPLGSGNPEQLYAMPDKKKGKGKDKPADVELYATPIKKTGNTADKGKKEKKAKKGKDKPKKGDIYENAQLNSQDKDLYSNANETLVYEDVGNNAAQQPQRNVNQDGLIYLDVVFQKDPNKGKEKKIHGLDDMTEYGEIDFTKKADPLPDSDEEDEKK